MGTLGSRGGGVYIFYPLLTDSPSIRDVLQLVLMRPDSGAGLRRKRQENPGFLIAIELEPEMGR